LSNGESIDRLSKPEDVGLQKSQRALLLR
ncbi:MAG: hypothetical protein RL235_918, partial [Chlamydiota bacterium]